jgi:hypothetical protein
VQDEAEEAAFHDGTWARARRRTTLLANLAVVMERTDECDLALMMSLSTLCDSDTTCIASQRVVSGSIYMPWRLQADAAGGVSLRGRQLPCGTISLGRAHTGACPDAGSRQPLRWPCRSATSLLLTAAAAAAAVAVVFIV